MRLLDRWRRVPAARRSALRESLAAVILVRLCLHLLPWRMWARVVGSPPRAREIANSVQPTADDVIWAVGRVSRAVPGATCLTQALAAQLLLSRRGQTSQLRIGVTRAPHQRLRAHAWLERDGIIVIGAADVAAYTPLRAMARGGETSFIGMLVR